MSIEHLILTIIHQKGAENIQEPIFNFQCSSMPPKITSALSFNKPTFALCFNAVSTAFRIDSIFTSSPRNSLLVLLVLLSPLSHRYLYYFIFNFSFMNMYVSNLSFNTSDAELQDLFAKFGTVSSAKVITDRETGRSRGFGFVEMPSDDESKDAMLGLNNKEIEGRAMSVSEAKQREERSNGGGGGYSNNRGGGGGGNRRW